MTRSAKYRIVLSAMAVAVIVPATALMVGSALGQNGAEVAEEEELLPPEAFDSISDSAERSAAMFDEMVKVFRHPRCNNCHVDGDRPRQGDDRRLHQPWVRRGDSGFGVPGLRCYSCHNEENFDPAGIPGAVNWHLAPRSMAWEGKSATDICEQLKDPERNGDRSLADIVEHVEKDPLVTWGWAPGGKRASAPGTQAVFVALMGAWVENGAVCPIAD